MDPIVLLMRILHIVPAVILGGGILFMWSSLLPGIAGLDEETRKSVAAGIRGKWAKAVMICSALLLASGLYNAVQNIGKFDYPTVPYHPLVALKLLLGIAVMFITSRLAGRSESAEKFREKMPFWMTVNSVLVIVIILAGSTMKSAERIPKTDAPAADDIQLEVDVDV